MIGQRFLMHHFFINEIHPSPPFMYREEKLDVVSILSTCLANVVEYVFQWSIGIHTQRIVIVCVFCILT